MTTLLDEPIISPMLVGRTFERNVLYQVIHQAKNGAGQAILISGEAGIGKSRLVQESINYATAQGFLVLKGCCFPPDVNCPYAPILDLLRTHFADGALDSSVSRDFLIQEHFPLLPEIIPITQGSGSAALVEPEQEKRRLFAVLMQLLRRQTEKQPILYLIEDIHWSDSASLEFLHYLVRRSAAQPLLVILTYRSEENSYQLRPWLAQLDRERLTRELHLTHLTLAHVKAMLGAMLEAGQLPHSDFVNAVYESTEGNPFFIEELLKSLVESGDLRRITEGEQHPALNSLRIPRTVEDAVQQRFQRLSEAARETATLAAVIGRRFDFPLLQTLLQWSEEALVQVIKELVAAHLIVEESADRFVFRHALTQQAIYATLLGREQKNLHQKIAETMEGLYANTQSLHTQDLAHHFHVVGAWKKSFDYSLSAGDQALRLYDPYTAIKHFTRAHEAAQHLIDAPILALHQKRGQAYEMLGDFEKARLDFEAVLNIARTTQNVTAEWQGLIALGFLWSSRNYGPTGDYYQQALQLARTIADPLTLAHTLNRLGNWYLNVEEPSEAQRYHREALNIFQGLNALEGVAETLDLLGMTSCLGGDLVRGADYLKQAAVYFRNLDNRAGLVSSGATLILCGMTYQTNSMISPETPLPVLALHGEAAIKLAQENGLRSGEAYALCQLSYCLGSQGEYSRSLELVQQAATLAADIEHRQWTLLAHTVWGAIFLDILAVEQARQHLEQALQIAQEVGSLHWLRTITGYLASIYLLQNIPTQAKAALDAVLGPDTPAQTIGQRLCWVAHAEFALAQGDLNTALKIVEKLLTSAENRPETGMPVLPYVSLLYGQILSRLHRFAEAEASLQAVLRLVNAHGAQPLVWRTHLALGNLYMSQGRQSAAEDEFMEANTVMTALAADVPDEALRSQFIARATATVPTLSPQQQAKKALGGLTRRERDVAMLVTQGKSNRDIAETLVVSERTIETHISNIFTKLGFTSRAQIAVWATEKGLHQHDDAE